VWNKYDFYDLSGTGISWDLLADGKIVASGKIPSLVLQPNEKRLITISLPGLKPSQVTEYFLNVYLKTTSPWGLLPAGHTLASEQFALPSAGQPSAVSLPAKQQRLNISENSDAVDITGEQFAIRFSKMDGALTSYKYKNVEFIVSGPLPNFRRAPTDNDIGNGMAKRCQPWFDATEKLTMSGFKTENNPDGTYLVSVTYIFPEEIASETVTYLIHPDGTITITASLKPLKEKLPELPRFGLNMRINQAFQQVTWYGRGPWENYTDRKTASFVGLYQGTVDEQFTPYARPQENGYKTDVRWVKLESQQGAGLKFSGDPLISFSALPYTYDDMKGFKHGGKHLNDLEKKPFVDLNIDYGQMGVGGDDSWGAKTHAQYTLPAKEYVFCFTMEAVEKK